MTIAAAGLAYFEFGQGALGDLLSVFSVWRSSSSVVAWYYAELPAVWIQNRMERNDYRDFCSPSAVTHSA
jgi:hypothetical protein